MNKLGGKYQRNRWFVLLMIPIFVYQIIYISTATANVPLMDYWRYINMFVEKINTTGLSFGDIWKNDHIHRSPLQFFYFAANIRLFNYNIQIEEYLGVFLMTLTIFLLYRWIKKEMPNQISAFYGIAGTIIALILFNSNQWEMITQEFALSFASRQILFFMSFLLTSRYLTNLHSQKAKTVELALLYILTILLVGSGYFPAFVATVAFSVILNYVLFYKENKNTYLVQYIVLLGALAVGTILYMYGIDLASNVPKIKYSLGECVVQFLQGSFVMIAVSWYGFAFSQRTMLVVGAVIFALYIAAFVVFFLKKYYKRTLVPILFYGYGAGAMGLVYMGRMGMYGLDYAYSSRYVCESNCLTIGFVWILLMIISDNLLEFKKKDKQQRKEKSYLFGAIATVLVIAVLIANFYSRSKEWETAPYRKAYCATLLEQVRRIDELTPEEFVPFQAPEDDVRQAVSTLKKYDLWIYAYE